MSELRFLESSGRFLFGFLFVVAWGGGGGGDPFDQRDECNRCVNPEALKLSGPRTP